MFIIDFFLGSRILKVNFQINLEWMQSKDLEKFAHSSDHFIIEEVRTANFNIKTLV
jgi:hypothetical protein